MTLSELAAAKNGASPPSVPPTGGGLKLNVHAKEEPKPQPPPVERQPRPVEPRCLGAACSGECLPMDWPEREPSETWEEARHGIPTETAIVLSQCGRWAWLCLLPCPNHPPKPILLHRWPVAGRLSQEAGGLATVESPCPWCHPQDGFPCPICDGPESKPLNTRPSSGAGVPSAGSVAVGRSPSGLVPALITIF